MRSMAAVVVCGAGVAGVSTAYHLAVRHGVGGVVLVDERPPLSLTSDKSTECYRNWWPGPGDDMVRMMNRSIDLLEELAEESGDVFHLNRRGYLYTTSDPARIADLEGFAAEASSLGAGPLRSHDDASGSSYQPAPPEGFENLPIGADLLRDPALIQKHFPYLSEEIVAALHVRRAGWLSAQQYGQYLLEAARQAGAQLRNGRVTSVEAKGGEVRGVNLAGGGHISAPVFVNAAGPLLAQVGEMLEVEIPAYNELHLKASFSDAQGVVGRDAPLLIDADPQTLEWSEAERGFLAEDPDTRWLTEIMPSGAHIRPEGGQDSTTLLTLWDYHQEAVEPRFPPPLDPLYPEVALRGLSKMVPGLRTYLERLPRPYLDGGYYNRTRENRPLACPLLVEGAYAIGAMSGYGIMASAALGELLAAHITGADLPDYAPAFDLARYQDPQYQKLLEEWGDSWQL